MRGFHNFSDRGAIGVRRVCPQHGREEVRHLIEGDVDRRACIVVGLGLSVVFSQFQQRTKLT